jgi:hypothetical protein
MYKDNSFPFRTVRDIPAFLYVLIVVPLFEWVHDIWTNHFPKEQSQ